MFKKKKKGINIEVPEKLKTERKSEGGIILEEEGVNKKAEKVSKKTSKEEFYTLSINLSHKKENTLENVFKDIKDFISNLEDMRLKGRNVTINKEIPMGSSGRVFKVNADLKNRKYEFKEI